MIFKSDKGKSFTKEKAIDLMVSLKAFIPIDLNLGSIIGIDTNILIRQITTPSSS